MQSSTSGNFEQKTSSVSMKKLNREEQLRIWQEAKKNRFRSTTYSKSHRTFQDLLRVYDSPKQGLKSSTCKKELRQSQSATDSLNSSILSLKNQISENENGDNYEINEVRTPRFSPKCLSAIKDEENEKSSDSEIKIKPSILIKENDIERAQLPLEGIDEDQELPSFQLKKILTEDKQLPSLRNKYTSFSFQGNGSSASSNASKKNDAPFLEDALPIEIKENNDCNAPFVEKTLPPIEINETNEFTVVVLIENNEDDQRNDQNLTSFYEEEEKKNHFQIDNKINTPKKKKTESKEVQQLLKDKESTDPAFVYSYSKRKAPRTMAEQYGVENVIIPVKTSSRKKIVEFHSIPNLEELKDVSKFLYLPNQTIEESFKPLNNQCLLVKQFLKANARTPEKKEDKAELLINEEKITKIEEISKVIDPNINQNGNYALLELTKEKAEKMKLGTRKIITPLKRFNSEQKEKDNKRKEDIIKASKGKEKDFGYVPFDENLHEIIEKIKKQDED